MEQIMNGKKFNRLTVIGYAGKNKYGRSLWCCECECGNRTVVDITSLKSGHTKSCGCYQREVVSQNGYLKITHGMSKTRLYREWAGMIQRCRCDKYYENVNVCKEWKDFEPFSEWALANGYEDDFEIDRIDNNGNYEPNNCRWTTRSQQMRNTSKNHNITYQGITKCQVEWLDALGLKSKKSFQMLRNKGLSDEQIINHYMQKRGIVNENS